MPSAVPPPVRTRLMLVTPPVADGLAIAARLAQACRFGDVAAVLMKPVASDERGLVNIVKDVAPVVQEAGAALVVEADPAVAVRGGADGVHLPWDLGTFRTARDAMRDNRIAGVGTLRSRHDAMDAGEAGADYVMFGEPRPDGSVPPLGQVLDRAGWWAEIFQVPCVAYAPDAEAVAPLVATGAEFVALGPWALDGAGDAGIAAAMAAIEAHAALQRVG